MRVSEVEVGKPEEFRIKVETLPSDIAAMVGEDIVVYLYPVTVSKAKLLLEEAGFSEIYIEKLTDRTIMVVARKSQSQNF